MIIDFLMGILRGVLDPLLGALPVVDLMGSVPGGQHLGVFLDTVDKYVPIVTPLSLILDVIAIGAFFIPIAIITWIWKLLPGKAT